MKIFLLFGKSIDPELSFGTDYTDCTVFFVVIEMQGSEFLLRTILRKLEKERAVVSLLRFLPFFGGSCPGEMGPRKICAKEISLQEKPNGVRSSFLTDHATI
jgi:hypothetical protein